MKKYNEVVEFHKQGMDKCNKITDEQAAIVEKAKNEAEEIVGGALKAFTDELEAKVKDWTSEDYDQFIQMAENDVRLDNKGILTISTAYAKTHKDDGDRVNNSACKKALLELALDNMDGMLAVIGIR